MRGQVLLIDDETSIRRSTCQWLEMADFEVQSFASAEQALERLEPMFPGVIVSDVRMPVMDGLQLLEEAIRRVPELPVILLTAHGDVDMAIRAMRIGAYDFIEKPFVPERLVETIHRACEKRRLVLENLKLQQDLASQSGIDGRIIGISPAIQRMKRELLKLAQLETPLIIYGETGTGKELVAQCLHEFSPRANAHFVPINCGAVPESLIESELFGHEAGAFTSASKRRIGRFEYADRGTLFLDEIESMPAALQVRLLRVLQEGVIERLGSNEPVALDVRVLAASKADLREEPGFREDLFYRLNVAQLHIPPLRERAEDIPLLFDHYLRKAAASHQARVRSLSEQEIQLLQQYAWPGNVRELKNIAIRYALDESAGLMELLYPETHPVSESPQRDGLTLAQQMAVFESRLICRSLQRHAGCISEVMKELDLPRRTLNQKMAKYGINRSDYLAD